MSHVTHTVEYRIDNKAQVSLRKEESQLQHPALADTGSDFWLLGNGRGPPPFCCFLVGTSILKTNGQGGPFVEVVGNFSG